MIRRAPEFPGRSVEETKGAVMANDSTSILLPYAVALNNPFAAHGW